MKWAVLVLGACLLLPAGAQAEPAATAEGDLAIAKAFWGREPTDCSSVTFSTEVHQGAEAGGEATEPVPGDPPIACMIAVREVWSTPAESPVRVCVYAVHEWGHLLGEGHSSDPNSVMYFEPAASSVPACETWIETPEGQEWVAHRQGWREWQEERSQCRVSHGPFRPRCWSKLRQMRLALREQ
jgi:Matrixin